MLQIPAWKRILILAVCLAGIIFAFPNAFYTRVGPQPVAAPETALFNAPLADALGLDFSGLSEAERILKDVKGISFNYFTAKDVVRHPMVAKIIEAYDADTTNA